MEVWELLRPSFRRILVLVAAGLIAAVAAVNVEHLRADTVKVDASAYFAQALGLDTTSFSVDPTAAQLVSLLELPEVQQSAASSAKVPLSVVKGATITHDTGSPVIDVSVTSADTEQARAAAPALAFAGLAYFAQQSLNHAESVQSSSTASLTAANAQLAAYRTQTGVANVDTAVAEAAAAVAAASTNSGTRAAQGKLAALQALQALQPQYDVLSSQVAGAQTTVSTAYTAVSAARSAAAAAALPGNVVTAPAQSVSRLSSYLRAAVGALVVVVVLGMVVFLLLDLRRRQLEERRAARREGRATGPTGAQEATHVRLATEATATAADPPAIVPPAIVPSAVDAPAVNPPAVDAPAVNPPAVDAPAVEPAPSAPIDVPAEPRLPELTEPGHATDPYQVAALRVLPWAPAALVPTPDGAAVKLLSADAPAQMASPEGGQEQQPPTEEFPSWPIRVDDPGQDASAEAVGFEDAPVEGPVSLVRPSAGLRSDVGSAGDRSGDGDAPEVLPASGRQSDEPLPPGALLAGEGAPVEQWLGAESLSEPENAGERESEEVLPSVEGTSWPALLEVPVEDASAEAGDDAPVVDWSGADGSSESAHPPLSEMLSSLELPGDDPVRDASAEVSAAEAEDVPAGDSAPDGVSAEGWLSDVGSAGDGPDHEDAAEALQEQQSNEEPPAPEPVAGQWAPTDRAAEQHVAASPGLDEPAPAAELGEGPVTDAAAAEALAWADAAEAPAWVDAAEVPAWASASAEAPERVDASADAREAEDVFAAETPAAEEQLEAPLTEPLPFEWAPVERAWSVIQPPAERPADEAEAPGEGPDDPGAEDVGAGQEPLDFQPAEAPGEWDADDDAAARNAAAQTYFQP